MPLSASRVLSPPRTLEWLVVLRWHAVGAQALLVLLARALLDVHLPTIAMVTVIATIAASNALLHHHQRQRGESVDRQVAAQILELDVVALTLLLALAGGAGLVFAPAYLVLVLVAALALSPVRSGVVLFLASAGYAGLLVLDASAVTDAPALTLSRKATWLAFVLTGAIVTAVVTRFARALREQSAALDAARTFGARARTIASIGGLAAGAAHELNTPLGTIAILSNELARVIETDPARAIEDAEVIRDQVERCRSIVQHLATRATEQVRESPETVRATDLRHDAMTLLAHGEKDRVAWVMGDATELRLPRKGLVQALVSLVGNALHATRARRTTVSVTIDETSASVRFLIVDRGPGIAAHLRDRLGEPFVTTKAPGEGMGLGIFLCQSFADAWGGALSFADNPGGGTRVTLEIPRRCSTEVAA